MQHLNTPPPPPPGQLRGHGMQQHSFVNKPALSSSANVTSLGNSSVMSDMKRDSLSPAVHTSMAGGGGQGAAVSSGQRGGQLGRGGNPQGGADDATYSPTPIQRPLGGKSFCHIFFRVKMKLICSFFSFFLQATSSAKGTRPTWPT